MLEVRSDMKNTNATTNKHHYALGLLMLASGVPVIENDAHLTKLVARVLLLDIMPTNNSNGEPLTVAELVEWVRSFGKVYTNASARTDASVAKSAREARERIARHAVTGK